MLSVGLPLPVVVEKCARRSGPDGRKHDRRKKTGWFPVENSATLGTAIVDEIQRLSTEEYAAPTWKAVKDGIACFVETTRGAVGFYERVGFGHYGETVIGRRRCL